MSRRVRLLVVPAILLAVIPSGVFVLAEAHPAKDDAASAPVGGPVAGDAARGEELFADTCAGCHGDGGTGGGVGPTLAAGGVSTDVARATIENGRGVMPADLVSGQDLNDVLAYLATITR